MQLTDDRKLATLVLVVTGVVVWLDVWTGTSVRLVRLLVVLPAFVAGLGNVRQTTVVAGWVFVVVTTAALIPPYNMGDTLAAIVLELMFCGLSVGACHWRIRRESEIRRLRSAAVALQRQILRPFPLRTAELSVDGLYEPLQEDRLIGGDVYEVVASPYGTRVLIGDVQGKGLPAIGVGFAVLGAFRESAVREPTLTRVVDALEEAVVRHNRFSKQSGDLERFVTALVLSIDDGPRVQAVNCGHLQPQLLNADVVSAIDLGTADVPLGMAELTGGVRSTADFGFPSAATLLICTDGVTEARGPAGDFYPLEERLPRWTGLAPAELTEELRGDLTRFSRGVQRDDIAMLALRRRPQPAAADEGSAG
ncbi:PP2C family protein-serine/threonine phosphatase [Streptomyces sp. TP-A0874]|uniref:PP2C family protein-serine/threonine phosphatase n=1 Tax=Streptomyces sp. TP-A0874 TaxID=549819 RepID=UPI000852C79F|nr:PP2C family protein-serine/threonine phosphatase [Streptomyces sp. TP-A0874]